MKKGEVELDVLPKTDKVYISVTYGRIRELNYWLLSIPI